MTHIIYKYGPLSTNGETVDFKGEPVHVGYQDDSYAPHPDYRVFIWCRIDGGPERSPVGVAKIVATGERYEGKHIGSVVMPSGLVWHVVEVGV